MEAIQMQVEYSKIKVAGASYVNDKKSECPKQVNRNISPK